MTQKKFERYLIIFVALLAALRLVSAFMNQREREVEWKDAPPSAPEFVWRDFDSNPMPFSALKGKVVVLHFWASWCGPCRSEFPHLLEAAEQLKDDAVFLTITADESDIAARKFLATAKEVAKVKPDNVLYGFDPMKKLTFETFGASALPETIIIDPEQKMRRKVAGMVNWGDPKVIDYIRELKHEAPSSLAAPVPK